MCWFSGYKACGTLVPQPGIEPAALEVEVWLLNLRTPRELPPRDSLSNLPPGL